MSWVGCSSLMSSATTGVAKNLTSAVLNQDDVLLVKEGAPAYLIAIDGLVEGDPKNQTLLLALWHTPSWRRSLLDTRIQENAQYNSRLCQY